MRIKRIEAILLTVALLLLIPFVAMQFTEEVKWSLFDFVAAGFLLLSAGMLVELVLRKIKKVQHRIILCLVILAVLALIWIELAVGVLGTTWSGN